MNGPFGKINKVVKKDNKKSKKIMNINNRYASAANLQNEEENRKMEKKKI